MRILCTGDSITAAGRDVTDPHDLGDGYVARLAAALPGHAFLDTGINGNKVPDLQARWDEDVLAHAPDLLSVMVGVNDTWHAHLPDRRARLKRLLPGGGGTTHARFESGFRELLERTSDAGVPRVVVIEPFLVPQGEDQRRMFADLREKARLARVLADEHGVEFVAVQEAFSSAPDPSALVHDGVHPTPAGHDLIAAQWLDVVALPTG